MTHTLSRCPSSDKPAAPFSHGSCELLNSPVHTSSPSRNQGSLAEYFLQGRARGSTWFGGSWRLPGPVLSHQSLLPAVPPIGEILDKTGAVHQGLLSVKGQSISPANEQSSSSWELRGLTLVGLAALHRHKHAACSSHQAKWKMGWEGRQWHTLRLVPAIPLQPGWDLHSKKLPESSEEG